jgi:hypothetical protein
MHASWPKPPHDGRGRNQLSGQRVEQTASAATGRNWAPAAAIEERQLPAIADPLDGVIRRANCAPARRRRPLRRFGLPSTKPKASNMPSIPRSQEASGPAHCCITPYPRLASRAW